MRRTTLVAVLPASAAALMMVATGLLPRTLTPFEMTQIRGTESVVCYKNSEKLCLYENPCPGLLTGGASCPATAWYEETESYDLIVAESFNTSPGSPGEPWYKEFVEGDTVYCYAKYTCVRESEDGFNYCNEGEFVEFVKPGYVTSYTAGDVCEANGGA